MKLFQLLFAFTFVSQISLSQQTSIELNPVTISASLHPVPSLKTGRNIISIPGEQFSKLPVHSLDELLRYVPGIEVQMRGPQGSQSDIVIRGGTFQQVLVILDGIRLNDPNTGHFNSYIPIAPSEIERIEILKGASSAIYGSEAVGGVINIITKSFSAKKNHAQKNINGSITVGEYNLVNASAGVFWQKGNTAISGGLLSNNSEGQIQRGTRGFFHNHTASLSINQFLNENWSISIRSSYDIRKFAAQNFYTTFASDTADEKVSGSWNQARVNYSKGRHRVSLDAGYKKVNDVFRFNPSSTANNNKSGLLQLLLTDHFQLKAGSLLSGGIQFQQRAINSNDRGKHSLSQAAAFVIYHQSLGEFSFSPSLRLDYSERRGTELVPQINLSYHLDNWQFRASAGRTIRDADFTERFNNYNKAFVAGGSVGNPDLKEESSFSFEMGADFLVNKSLKISATAFQRQQNNLIDWVTTSYSEMPRKENLSPTGTFALARNIAEVNTSGLELDIHFNKKLAKDHHLVTSVGFLWLDNTTLNGTPSFYLSSHAKFMTNFNLSYSNRLFSVSINGIYKYRTPQTAASINTKLAKEYFLVNAMISAFISKGRASIFVEVDNVGDSRYSDLLGSQMPGRWMMGGVRFNLKNILLII